MARARIPRFDALETRQLLSTLHHAAKPATSVPLDGTLQVYGYSTPTGSHNLDGSSILTIPVAGTVSTLGPVRGFWRVIVGSSGSRVGSDYLTLENGRGSVTLQFNNQQAGAPKGSTAGPLSHQHRQALASGSGAYAHVAEKGTITLTSDATRSSVVSMTLKSTAS